MSKTKNLFEERILEREKIHEKLLKKEMKNLDEKLRSEKYKVENIVDNSTLGGVYHNLIDSKDYLNSEIQSKYNQTYHSIDVELYKLNKKLDGKTRMINYQIDNKKEKVFKKIYHEIM